MGDNNVKQELFACCITDGILNDISPEQRIVMIIDINEIKEEMLNDYHPPRATEKTLKKYQNNRGGQNNGKVSK